MAFVAITYVRKHSQSKNGARLVMLTLAEYAHEDGTEAFPNVETIMGHTNLSERSVRYCLRKLEEAGEVQCTGTTKSGVRVYRIVGMHPDDRGANIAPPANSAPGKSCPPGGQILPPIQSINASAAAPKGAATEAQSKQKTSSSVSTQRSARERDDRKEIVDLCELLAELMLTNDPRAKVAPASTGWRDACRRLLDLDGRTVPEVEQVIRWTQADDFEAGVVHSMQKLRKRFPELLHKATRPPRRRSGGPKLMAAPAPATSPCTAPLLPAQHVALWASVQSELRRRVAAHTYEIWLEPLHLHGLDGDTLVIAAPAEVRAWVQERFSTVLAAALKGRPYRVVGCEAKAARAAA